MGATSSINRAVNGDRAPVRSARSTSTRPSVSSPRPTGPGSSRTPSVEVTSAPGLTAGLRSPRFVVFGLTGAPQRRHTRRSRGRQRRLSSLVAARREKLLTARNDGRPLPALTATATTNQPTPRRLKPRPPPAHERTRPDTRPGRPERAGWCASAATSSGAERLRKQRRWCMVARCSRGASSGLSARSRRGGPTAVLRAQSGSRLPRDCPPRWRPTRPPHLSACHARRPLWLHRARAEAQGSPARQRVRPPHRDPGASGSRALRIPPPIATRNLGRAAGDGPAPGGGRGSALAPLVTGSTTVAARTGTSSRSKKDRPGRRT
jgi:hypothetical protein